MKTDINRIFNAVLETIFELAGEVKYPDDNGKMLNERYIHHLFSHRMQKKLKEIDLSDPANSIIHPEWPTYKEESGIRYGQYKYEKCDESKEFKPVDKGGSGGHLDFALGDYEKPEIAIEFKLSYGHANLTPDIIKLMDKANPFKFSILFGTILREKGLPGTKDTENLADTLERDFNEARQRLENENRLATDRKLIIIVAETDKNNSRFWYLDEQYKVHHTDNLGKLKEKFRAA